LDLKITQELPGFRKDDLFIITLGIENLLNLIDNNEGEVLYGAYQGRIPVYDLLLTDDYSKYIYGKSGSRVDYAYGYDKSNPFDLSKSAVNSIWRAQLGLVYKFKF